MAEKVKNLPAMCETHVRSLGWEDLLQKGMATHSSILGPGHLLDRGASWRGCRPWGRQQTKAAEQLNNSRNYSAAIAVAAERSFGNLSYVRISATTCVVSLL